MQLIYRICVEANPGLVWLRQAPGCFKTPALKRNVENGKYGTVPYMRLASDLIEIDRWTLHGT